MTTLTQEEMEEVEDMVNAIRYHNFSYAESLVRRLWAALKSCEARSPGEWYPKERLMMVNGAEFVLVPRTAATEALRDAAIQSSGSADRP